MLGDSPALQVKLGTMVVPTWQGEEEEKNISTNTGETVNRRKGGCNAEQGLHSWLIFARATSLLQCCTVHCPNAMLCAGEHCGAGNE